MRLSSTSRNDTDNFFALFLIESMDDQQNRTGAYGSNGYAPLLIFRSEVALSKSIGIVENAHGRFKANIVFAKVLPVFLLIPLKSHNLVATTTAYGLFLHVSIRLYVHAMLGVKIRSVFIRYAIVATKENAMNALEKNDGTLTEPDARLAQRQSLASGTRLFSYSWSRGRELNSRPADYEFV